MKFTTTSIIENKEEAEVIFENVAKVVPKATSIFVGNTIVKVYTAGFITADEIDSVTQLGLKFADVEAVERDELATTFTRSKEQ